MTERRRSEVDILRPEIHPLTLSFAPTAERKFMDEYMEKSLGQVRLTILMGTLFYMAFAILDAAVAPAALKTLWIIRFAVILPLSALLYVISYMGFFRRIWQLAMSAWLLLGGFGIVAMIGIVQGEARNSYYAGLIMDLIVLYTWSRVRFIWATLTGWLIVMAYEILTLGFLHLPAQTVLTHNFFFVGSNLLGMLACYSIERYARRESVMARLLQEEQEKVRKTNQELAAANAELENQALLDELTQIPNRRRFDQELTKMWRQMAREGRPLSLLFCDIDHFKLFNDTYGHPSGDECLVKVARVVAQGAQRPLDFAARFGGEEFAVLLPGEAVQGAGHVAEDICQAVRNLGIPHSRSDAADRVTISIGAATVFPSVDRGPEALIKKADECLYQAKQQGRNQIVAAKA